METIGTYTPENFFAGPFPIEKGVALVGSGSAVKKHEPIKLSDDGTITPVTLGTESDADATTGAPAMTAEQNTVAGLYGIAAEDGDIGAEIAVYLTGEYFADSLVLQDGVTTAVLTPEFRKLGIFLKNLT